MDLNDLRRMFGALPQSDEKSLQSLFQALQKSNQPQFDYLEFKMSLYALSGMQLEPDTAVRSAFVTATTVGLTKDKLLASARQYIQVLEREKQEFDQTVQNQLRQKVDGRLAFIEDCKSRIQQFQAQIADLQRKIAETETSMRQAESEIAGNRERISSVEQGFAATYTQLVDIIQSDIKRFEQIL